MQPDLTNTFLKSNFRHLFWSFLLKIFKRIFLHGSQKSETQKRFMIVLLPYTFYLFPQNFLYLFFMGEHFLCCFKSEFLSESKKKITFAKIIDFRNLFRKKIPRNEILFSCLTFFKPLYLCLNSFEQIFLISSMIWPDLKNCPLVFSFNLLKIKRDATKIAGAS